ncbi:MAG: exonuclease SbcCD subunit D [Candidatus Parvarchaeota archaeon]|nr:exonuclease SbcCD subunit D [Candidatus Parvarchaeota archaeon]MCW1301519.1 exonuclease SbcCD subunit D [Candidatus Parvarchaeota archaeon]
MSYRFIHTGDTHIGNVYKDSQRNNDIKDAFIQLIDYAIDSKVDFIVHSGDLFDSGTPDINDLLFMTDQLHRLKDNNIKIFTVPGSHDVGIGEELSIVDLFDRNGLLVNLNSSRYMRMEGGKVYLKGATYLNAFIAGVRGKRSRVEDEIFKVLSVEMDQNAWIKIFVFHHTISSLGEAFSDLDTDSLPKGFDYYAAGHWHGHKDNIQYGSGIIQYPGSTEYCDEKEMVDNPNRGFYVVEYSEGGITSVEYHLLKTRDKDIIRINADGKDSKSIKTEIVSNLKENDGKMLVILVNGKLNGKRSELDTQDIKLQAKSLGYSYVSINTSKMLDSDSDTITLKSENITDIEDEFLSAKGYNKKEIALAHTIIDMIEEGKDLSGVKSKVLELYDNQ